jgi:Chaperone for flagella basal body P-ring formation
MIGASRFVAGVMLLLAAASSAGARTAAWVPVGTGPVVEALHRVGIESTVEEIEFLTSVAASSSQVGLHVTDWRMLDTHTDWVRLACRRAQECLPFFILLHRSDRHTEPELRTFVSAAKSAPARRKTHAPALIRAGSRVTMILQTGAAQITTPAICLDNGDLGSRVRVTNLATRQVMTAEIIDQGLVRSAF